MAKDNMFNSFDCFGVEVYRGKEINNTAFFNGLNEAIRYAEEKQGQGFTTHYITANKWGIKIDLID